MQRNGILIDLVKLIIAGLLAGGGTYIAMEKRITRLEVKMDYMASAIVEMKDELHHLRNAR